MNNKTEQPAQKYQVWECKIVVPGDAELPDGFDGHPRVAAMMAVANADIDVITRFSGWGGELDADEASAVRRD